MFEPVNGNMVSVGGHIAVYERDGVYQLYADWIREQGKGDLMQRLRCTTSMLKSGITSSMAGSRDTRNT